MLETVNDANTSTTITTAAAAPDIALPLMATAFVHALILNVLVNCNFNVILLAGL